MTPNGNNLASFSISRNRHVVVGYLARSICGVGGERWQKVDVFLSGAVKNRAPKKKAKIVAILVCGYSTVPDEI